MSLLHRAYAFGWNEYQADPLSQLLPEAPASADTTKLAEYVAQHRAELRDPTTGDPLPENWEEQLARRDVHGYGELALTKFYNPQANFGLADVWVEIDGFLPDEVHQALLGWPLGTEGAAFDPTGEGTFFQLPAEVASSVELLRSVDVRVLPEFDFEPFERLLDSLDQCVAQGQGLYISFASARDEFPVH